MKIIDGRKIAKQILSNVKNQLLTAKQPTLAVILVGNDPASHLYVSIKEQRAREVGINFEKHLLPTNSAEDKIIDLIHQLNNNKTITAILVQLPLPKHLNSDKIISQINPNKDADGIHPLHLKMLKQAKTPPVLPATTQAVFESLKYTRTNLKNKSIAIIGKSKIVGLPTYYYFKNKFNKTKTTILSNYAIAKKFRKPQINIYDSHTKNLSQKTNQADILIVAIGQPHFITDEYVKSKAIVIDVGINKLNGQTVGDVDPISIKNKAQYLTPVPGGIGPITVACLLKNTLKLDLSQN